MQEIEEALREKREYALEFRIVPPDGTVKYLESTGHPLLSADGERCRDGRYAHRCDGT